MASVPQSLPSILTERWSAQRWPESLSQRTLLRLLLCLPYLALAVWADHRGFHSTINTGLAAQGEPVALFSSNLDFLAQAYPPVPTVLAAIVPGGVGALAVLGALATGGLLHLCWERLVRADAPGRLIAALLLGLACMPAFWFNATQNLVGFLGLALFAITLAGMLDFLFSGRTSSGFAAGLSLGFAVLCDPAALVYALSVAVAAPFLAWERFRNDPQAIASTMAVLLYPTLMFLTAWAFLQWRFTGALWHEQPIAPHAFRFPHGVLGYLGTRSERIGLQVLCSPVFLLSAFLVLRRRPIAFVALVIVPLDLIATVWLGLRATNLQGLVLLNLIGVLAVPTRPPRIVCALYLVAAPLGVLLSILLLDQSSHVLDFVHAIGL